MRRLSLALAAPAVLLALPAQADELWSSTHGMIAWETDLGETAVLRLDDQGAGRVVRMLLPGLAADMTGGRGAYLGLWIADSGDRPCLTEMVDPVSGIKTPHWGTVTLTFLQPHFPSDWAGVYGHCLSIAAEPLTGTVYPPR